MHVACNLNEFNLVQKTAHYLEKRLIIERRKMCKVELGLFFLEDLVWKGKKSDIQEDCPAKGFMFKLYYQKVHSM